ncbi:acyl carrier protein [Herbivorax sp. ANBcel31]|uniref:acyl carrier protein n=1 Tax=Herbivorax sp. ANBcel31 TaxID=3069754 RepID=UPI0027B033AD|nr:acyl carrier protein [Herbivorax sp. ANBcel31]MDQ2087524.1 acyl carrier protein [Herbivorax sp. ANBcel31]
MTFEKRVIGVVRENIEGGFEITTNSRLIEDLGVDSFSKIMIIAGLEDEFSIEIEEEDFSEIESVSDIIDRVKLIFSKGEGECSEVR